MKAIQQLIDYFSTRGKLSRTQLDELVKRGYWGNYTPADLRSLESKIGESFVFNVTGTSNGPVWGTDTYTSDSSLSCACVHAGVLQSGEAGAVEVTMVKPLPVFSGSTRNGITSSTWTTGWSGAYRVGAIKR